MHKIVIEELERHLAGRASAAFHDHVAQCGDCRDQLTAMEEMSASLRALRRNDEEVFAVPHGFYTRVATGIVHKQESSAWGMFAPTAVFFRRVAFASLLLLAGLGSYLITIEPEFSVNDATAIIARGSSPDTGVIEAGGAPASTGNRNQILLTLASWSE